MSLRITEVCKQFGSTLALDAISLDVPAGAVTALIGENGAGKSTLIKVLTGACAADRGSLQWQGAPLNLRGPRDARAAGIAVLHQDPQLVDALDGIENLFMGRRDFGSRGGLISRRRLRARAEAVLARYGFAVPLDVLSRDMSPAQRTLLALARCLLDAPSLLILDEPTASLTAVETAWLARAVTVVRAEGAAVLFVSHRLDEVLAMADRVVVMRNGRVVTEAPTAGQTHETLVGWMSGDAVVARAPAAPGDVQLRPTAVKAATTVAAPCRLDVEALATRDGRVRDASLRVHAGEIVGLYGLAGAGRTELLEAIYGARALAPGGKGRVSIDGRAFASPSPAGSLRAGVCLIPEDRKRHALMPQRSLLDNLSLSRLRAFARGGIVDAARERRAGAAAVATHAIRTSGLGQPVGELSGGNQQKAVFARAMANAPGVLLCDEPTQAVDVMTRRAIHALIHAHVADGGAALVVTSDLDELVALADRVLVMRQGRIAQRFDTRPLSAQAILHACFPPATTPTNAGSP